MQSLCRNSVPGARVPITPCTEPGSHGWLLIAASARGAAERFAAEHGLLSPMIVDRYELAGNPVAFARACRSPAIEHVAVHSLDWEREMMPQLYAAALLSAAGRSRWLVDERAGTIRRLSVRRLAAAGAAAPALVGGSLARGMADAIRFIRRSQAGRSDRVGRRDVMLAIWAGDVGASVGGAVTHISGVLGAVRRRGLRIGLVTSSQPPPQVTDSVDDLEIAPPEPSGARFTPELARLASNRTMMSAADRLVSRLGSPGIVYQRHAALRTVGVELAERYRAPLILEWNGSASWAFAHWSHGAKLLKGPTGSLIAAIEQRVVGSADLIAAVSRQAGEMALHAGADPARVITSPNAVDLEAVDSALAGHTAPARDHPLVGWIGTFGSWHGAEVLVRAIPHLPSETRVLMVGEGRGRPACERLAAEFGVLDRVTWTGRTPHDEAIRLLADCDVLTAPHIELTGGEPFFGSPTKLFEYMALARPIVASELGQIGEVLEHGRTSLLVTPGDERELGEAVSALLADPERGRKLAREARRQAEASHTWEHRAATILEALEG